MKDPSSVTEPPGCPKCGAPMELRTARQGRNAGGRFWGCTEFPRCRGTRDLGDDPEPPRESEEPTTRPASVPVEWTECTPRADFVPEYLSVGAMPGVLRDRLRRDARLGQVLSQCVLLSRRDRTRHGTTDSRLASALLLKILRRGRTPLSTLNVERAALHAHGLLDQVTEFSPDSAEVGWEPRPGNVSRLEPAAVLSIATERIPFVLDPAFGFDFRIGRFGCSRPARKRGSWTNGYQRHSERTLATGLRRRRRWTGCSSPPASPTAVARAALISCSITLAARRSRLEIDGPEHDATAAVDEARDDSLGSIGIDVVRVTNAEVARGNGTVLDRIRSHCLEALTAFPPARASDRNRRHVRLRLRRCCEGASGCRPRC